MKEAEGDEDAEGHERVDGGEGQPSVAGSCPWDQSHGRRGEAGRRDQQKDTADEQVEGEPRIRA